MAAKSNAGTVKFEGTIYNVSSSMSFASFYIAKDELTGERVPMIRFHKSETSARKGTWDSASCKAYWIYQGYCAIAR
jgi:hypothetical protein